MQGQLFHDSITDAIGADIAAIGGVKKVAGILWPAMESSSAASKLRSCLNVDQPHKLDPMEVITIKRLARDAGSTATVNYEAVQLGFRVEWTSPEDEQAALAKEIMEGLKFFNQRLARLELVNARNNNKLNSVR
jgi:hypothetical protein